MDCGVLRASPAQFLRYSTVGSYLGSCLAGGVSNAHRARGGGRPGAGHTRYRRNWSGQLYSGHTRLFNQDNSTVGRLTAEDIEKARSAKKTEAKQYQQAVLCL